MTRFSTLLLRFGTAATAAILIAACGGGGSDAPAPAPAPASQLASYAGTWQRCDVRVSRATPQVPNDSSAVRLTISNPAANNTVAVTSAFIFFTSLDCSGTPYATVTQPAITLAANGTKTIGATVVDRIDGSQVASTTTVSGINFTTTATEITVTPVGGVPFTTDRNVAASNQKGIGLVSGTNLDFGGNSTLDAQGYPTAFEPNNANRFTKQ